MKNLHRLSYLCLIIIFLCSARANAQQTITWKDTAYVTITGNKIENSTVGTNISGGTSTKRLDYVTDGWVRNIILQTDKTRVFGLSESSNNLGWGDVDYAIYIGNDSKLAVREFGTTIVSGFNYTVGDTLKVERKGIQVTYWNGQTLLHTSTRQSVTQLIVDISLYETGSMLNNIQASNSFSSVPTNTNPTAPGVYQTLTWTDIVNIGFVDSVLVKIDSTSLDNTAGLASVETLEFTEDGWLETTVLETNKGRQFGFSVQNSSNQLGTTDYGILFSDNGTATPRENRTSISASAVSIQTGDVLRVERINGFFHYKKNDSTFHISTAQDLSPMIADVTLISAHTTLNKLEGSPSFGISGPVNTDPNASGIVQNVTWTDINNLGFVDDKIINILTTSGWDYAGAVSVDFLPPTSDGWVETTVIQEATTKVFGLAPDNPNDTYGSIDYAILLTNNGNIQVWENGSHKFTHANTYQFDDKLRIERTGGVVSYFLNRDENTPVAFYTSATASNTLLYVDISFNNANSILGDIQVSDSFYDPNAPATGGYWTQDGNTVYYTNQVAIGRNSMVDDEILSVQGTILTQGVTVTMTGWADFVFEGKYNLRSLDKLAAYIKENGHLPEIPSEEEVLKEGIRLEEMNKKLLQKIEELTLYLLEQNQKNKDQEARIKALEEKLNKLPGN